jgi:4-alpha-glucanotransferase
MDLFTKARELGIQTEFIDGQGYPHVTAEAALKVIIDALPARAPTRFLAGPAVVRSGQPARTELTHAAALPLRWKIVAGLKVIAEGETSCRAIIWPPDLPVGSYRLHLTDGEFSEHAPLIVAPARAFGGDFDRCWLLAVQLYGVRSARNWGIGDFTDLQALLELARELGADGIGLNPLHALFDDRPADCSPYSPNSRLFLNPLYIDVEKLPEFDPGAVAGSSEVLARLRARDIVDYAAVAELKWRALRLAFEQFRAKPADGRKKDFAQFRAERGALLSHFATF